MKQAVHFRSQKERLDFLKGNFEEIVPKKARKKATKKKEAKKDEVQAE